MRLGVLRCRPDFIALMIVLLSLQVHTEAPHQKGLQGHSHASSHDGLIHASSDVLGSEEDESTGCHIAKAIQTQLLPRPCGELASALVAAKASALVAAKASSFSHFTELITPPPQTFNWRFPPLAENELST
ncbi:MULTISPECIES: hypothetical protein [Chelativorans]|jgi:hypothetical protein|uniref:Uncharacterized protein n=1 Tax=Chelativorans sp. (strain BNC1) TaxID=266779 RepID=Q11JC3_CHESB|nr:MULTISPECIES: hypothetical protein [Chelativorans]